MPKVSIIVPVYGVEKYIERCAVSLFEQTLEDVELIFVDDASKDNSISILMETASRYPQKQYTLLRHEENRGLPAARNTGLAAATGEYIFHCDSDDWPEKDMLEKMYNVAVESGADMVYCDFWLSFEKNERYMGTPDYTRAEDMLRSGFLTGQMKYNVWNKIVRRSLYVNNGIGFPEGHPMGEDMTMIMLAAKADKVVRVPEPLYHYVKLNEDAYSNSFSQKKLDDICYNVDRSVAFLRECFGDELENDINLFKLSIKLPFLITDDKGMYRIWEKLYPESDSYADANKALPKRTRLLQQMAAKGQWWYVSLYYKLVYKLIYGVIYK